METVRGRDDRPDMDPENAGVGDSTPAAHRLSIGGDERRMHVRAYNYWVSLLSGRPYPSIEDLDPGNITDFGPHSVLLDFSKGVDNPAIRYLGRSLRDECGVTADITHVASVPSRSLLSRLTDHYLQIIANRAPIGFEAEFVGQRGHNTLYRGILMPFSSDQDTIDYIYGVINWKELVDAETQALLEREVEAARRSAPLLAAAAPVWADGPSGGFGTPSDRIASASREPDPPMLWAQTSQDAPQRDDATTQLLNSLPDGLADRLALARESAEAARGDDSRSRASLYRALSRAYDFVCASEDNAQEYAELLADAGISVQARAPMTAAVKLVFGSEYDKTRLTEFAAVLGNARRNHVADGGLDRFISATDGGIKAIVKTERALRKPAPKANGVDQMRAELRARPAIAHVQMAAGGDEFVVLLARADAQGQLDIVARIDDDAGLAERALRKAVA